MESIKIVLIKLFAGQQWKHRLKEQTYGHSAGKEGEGRMYGENKIETCILLYVK